MGGIGYARFPVVVPTPNSQSGRGTWDHDQPWRHARDCLFFDAASLAIRARFLVLLKTPKESLGILWFVVRQDGPKKPQPGRDTIPRSGRSSRRGAGIDLLRTSVGTRPLRARGWQIATPGQLEILPKIEGAGESGVDDARCAMTELIQHALWRPGRCAMTQLAWQRQTRSTADPALLPSADAMRQGIPQQSRRTTSPSCAGAFCLLDPRGLSRSKLACRFARNVSRHCAQPIIADIDFVKAHGGRLGKRSGGDRVIQRPYDAFDHRRSFGPAGSLLRLNSRYVGMVWPLPPRDTLSGMAGRRVR